MDQPFTISIPEYCLVALVGASGSGKSTFAHTHFKPTEVLSSDHFRALVSDDENDLAATDDAFDALHYVAGKRLERLKLTVVDATNVQAFARKPLIELAKRHHLFPVAIVLDLPEGVCRGRNQGRTDRNFGPHVIGQHCRQLRQSLKKLKGEGFRRVFVLRSEEEVGRVRLERERVWNNRKEEAGPFDIIGDVHGCAVELELLLNKLGYAVEEACIRPPPGRKAVFVGDLVDRGPQAARVLRRVMGMVEVGNALCLPGNHDMRFMRALQGKKVQRTHGLLETLQQFEAEEPAFASEVADFINSLVSHYVLAGGDLVVAHAGMSEELMGRTSARVREFALYGETSGETDEFGLPIRYNWASDYRGQALVAYGHTPVPEPEWLNNTINIDTGCAFGGALTALRYPERELVSVPAERVYAEPLRPLAGVAPEATSAQQQHDDVLDIEDVLGKRIVETRWRSSVTIRQEQAIPTLEVMSRFTIDPRWLIYLPPTMSPAETSPLADYLEHPAESLAYYREAGVEQVVCEEKHMGSRACVVVCRYEEVAARRFGIAGGSGRADGACYTRTGRRFFEEAAVERDFLQTLSRAVSAAGLWDQLETDWLLLDCELLPWSARAQELLRQQYAAVAAAAAASTKAAIAALNTASARGIEVDPWLQEWRGREDRIQRYREAYRGYCWPVKGLGDLKLAPFHLLASEGAVHQDKEHRWHLDTLGSLCAADADLLLMTDYRTAELGNEASCASVTAWWEERVSNGSEGMVVKPTSFVALAGERLLQPAIKCRGREYLRIIYGPEYTAGDNLERLRWRNLRAKRSLALREFALGLEGLERFVKREPLRRVHECVFGVLAMETEPVDPRL